MCNDGFYWTCRAARITWTPSRYCLSCIYSCLSNGLWRKYTKLKKAHNVYRWSWQWNERGRARLIMPGHTSDLKFNANYVRQNVPNLWIGGVSSLNCVTAACSVNMRRECSCYASVQAFILLRELNHKPKVSHEPSASAIYEGHRSERQKQPAVLLGEQPFTAIRCFRPESGRYPFLWNPYVWKELSPCVPPFLAKGLSLSREEERQYPDTLGDKSSIVSQRS